MTTSRGGGERRRRENVEGGRHHSHRVLVSAEEEAVLVRLAAELRITVPRLLMEAALSGGGETPTRREHAIAELFELRRLLATVAMDVRALVGRDALGESAASAAADLLARAADVAQRVDATIDALAAS